MSKFTPPPGYSTLSPYLIVEDPDAVRDFVRAVFPEAQVKAHYVKPDGRTNSLEMLLGEGVLMIGRSSEGFGPFQMMLHIYVDDVEDSYARAQGAGAQPIMPPSEQFYGDFAAGVLGPQNNFWWIAHNRETLTEAEINRRIAEREMGKE
ncbi:MAG: hypothetical protein AAGN35_15670 [Bacteroidota bacterium]